MRELYVVKVTRGTKAPCIYLPTGFMREFRTGAGQYLVLEVSSDKRAVIRKLPDVLARLRKEDADEVARIANIVSGRATPDFMG